MSFSSLPNELICMIGDYLQPSDISSLMQTNHQLYISLRKPLLDSISWFEPDTWHNRGILTWACVHDSEDLVRELMKREGHFFWFGWADHLFLRQAAARGRTNLLRILLEKAGIRPFRAHIMTSLKTAAAEAVSNGHLETLKIVLGYPDIKPWTEHNGSGHNYYESAFRIAASVGNIQIMRGLLELETGSSRFSSKLLHDWRQFPIYAVAETDLNGTFNFLLGLPVNLTDLITWGNGAPLNLAAAAGASCSITVLEEAEYEIIEAVPSEPTSSLSWVTGRLELSREKSLNHTQADDDIRDILRRKTTPPRYLEPFVAEAKKRQEGILTGDAYNGMSLHLMSDHFSLCQDPTEKRQIRGQDETRGLWTPSFVRKAGSKGKRKR